MINQNLKITPKLTIEQSIESLCCDQSITKSIFNNININHFIIVLINKMLLKSLDREVKIIISSLYH